MEESILVHVKFDGFLPNIDGSSPPETIKVPFDVSWADFDLMLKVNYECENIQVKYMDEEDDQILINSQEEFIEAASVARTRNNVLYIIMKNLDASEQAAPLPILAEKPPTANHVVTDAVPERPIEPKKPKPQVRKIDDHSVAIDMEETGEVSALVTRDEETGAILARHHEVKRKLNHGDCYSQMAVEIGERRRQCHPPERSARKKYRSCDSESGESTKPSEPKHPSVPYDVLIQYMEKLKQDLRNEIVRDVTRKTVRQVLKGIDGAVLQSVQGTSGVPEPPSNVSPTAKPNTGKGQRVYWHEGIFCDNCNQTVVGARYKCGNCADYDLCEQCEALEGIHNVDHVFVKIRQPCKRAGFCQGNMVPLLRKNLYQPFEEPEINDIPRDVDIEDAKDVSLNPRLQQKMCKKQEKLKRKEERLLEKQKKKEEKLKRRLEQQRESMPHKREKLDLAQSLECDGVYELPVPVPVVEVVVPQDTVTPVMTESVDKAIRFPICRAFGAQFLSSVTIPEGTRVQPGTKLLKTWRLKNNGDVAWTNSTKLRILWGNIPTTVTEVSVPTLQPGGQGNVTVELIAPLQPGKYQSHWKMYDSGIQFGHRIWCSIYVDAKLVLEPTQPSPLKLLTQAMTDMDLVHEVSEETDSVGPQIWIQEAESGGSSSKVQQDLTTAAAAVAQLRFELPQPEEGGHDLLTFELHDLRTRGPKFSQTATPNNTPLDITPPKSPAPELVDHAQMSNSSSVELVPEDVEDGLDEPYDKMVEYVHERMSSLGLRPEVDIDVESLSSFTDDDSSQSDSDFFIVPFPDCFDTKKPLITSVFSDDGDFAITDDNHNDIPADGESQQVSLDDILTTSSSLDTPPLNLTIADGNAGENIPKSTPMIKCTPATVVVEYSCPMVKLQPSQTSLGVSASDLVDPVSCPLITSQPSPAREASTGTNTDGATEASSAAGHYEQQPATSTNQEQACASGEPLKVTFGAQAEEMLSLEEDESPDSPTPSSVTEQPKSLTLDTGRAVHVDCRNKDEKSPTDFANQLMSTAVHAATRAANHAYSTAKGVFYTLQARKAENTSGKPTWQPKDSEWKPAESSWQPAPAESSWQPAPAEWEPAVSEWQPIVNDWKPSQNAWQPPQSDWVPPADLLPPSPLATPMDILVEMGFCNRVLNQAILDKHNNDLEKTIAELLLNLDNDWVESRH